MKKSTMVWIQRLVGLLMLIIGAYVGIFLNEVNSILITIIFFALGLDALLSTKLSWFWDCFDEEEYKKKQAEKVAKRTERYESKLN